MFTGEYYLNQIKSNGLFCFSTQVLDYYTCKIQERLVNTYKNIKLVKKAKQNKTKNNLTLQTMQ